MTSVSKEGERERKREFRGQRELRVRVSDNF